MPISAIRVTAALAIVAGLVLGAPSIGLAADDDHLRVISVGERTPAQLTVVVATPYQLSGRVVSPTEFEATIDGTPRPVQVEHLPAKDLDVAIVLDNSAEVPPQVLNEEKGAVAELLVDLEGEERVALYATTTPAPLQAFTTDRQALLASLRGLGPGGESDLAPVLDAASQAMRPDPGLRRAVIGLSAGGREPTTHPVVELATDMVDAGVQFHWTVVAGEPPPFAQQLAGLTGISVDSTAPSPVAVLDRVAAELRSQYRITIDTGGSAGPVRLRLPAASPADEVAIGLPPGAVEPVPGTTDPPTRDSAAGQPGAAEAAPAPLTATEPGRHWWAGKESLGLVFVVAGAALLVLGHRVIGGRRSATPAVIASSAPGTGTGHAARAVGLARAPSPVRPPSGVPPWPPPPAAAARPDPSPPLRAPPPPWPPPRREESGKALRR